MSQNIIKNKSFDFALRIVKLYQFLCFEKINVFDNFKNAIFD